MNKVYSTFILLLIGCASFSQSGTIKIAKPAPPEKKDTIKPNRVRGIGLSAGTTFTFKNINEFGVEVSLLPAVIHHCYWGIRYCREVEYYELTPFNSEAVPQLHSGKSKNRFDYAKVAAGVSYPFNFGRRGSIALTLGADGEYLFNVKNEYRQLKYSDFRKFNVAPFAGLSISIGYRFAVYVRYSKDVLKNLKDNRIFDANGILTARQKSNTDLLTFSIATAIGR